MLVCDKLVALRQDNNLRKIGSALIWHNEGDTLSETNMYEYGNKYIDTNVCSRLCLSDGKIHDVILWSSDMHFDYRLFCLFRQFKQKLIFHCYVAYSILRFKKNFWSCILFYFGGNLRKKIFMINTEMHTVRSLTLRYKTRNTVDLTIKCT